MASAIIDGTNIDTSVFSYSAPKANPSGGKVVNLYNKNFRETLTISTPLILTWGAQEGMDQSKNPTGKFTMSLQFPNKDYPNADCEAFLKSMRTLESKIKADALVNSKEWFGKAMSGEVINAIFNPMLSYSKNPATGEPDLSKNPTLKVKLPFYEGEWKGIEIYDADQTALFPSSDGKTPKDIIVKGSDAALIITCGGLWFAGGSFGVTWRLVQAVLKPKPSLRGKCHIILDEDEQRRITATTTSGSKTSSHYDDDHVPSASQEVDVEDSDEEEEEDATPLQRTASVPAAAPVAAAAAPKKIVAKKK